MLLVLIRFGLMSQFTYILLAWLWVGQFFLGGGLLQPRCGWVGPWIFLIHWGRATHICVGKLNIIGSDNGLSPGRRQAIICTNTGILLIRPWGTNFNEIFIGNQIFSFKKMHLKLSSAKWHLVYLGLNVLSTSTADVSMIPSFRIWDYVMHV